MLLKLSKTLQCLNPTFDNASFQVNLDNHLSLEQLILFLKFFSTYEDVIYRFSRGTNFDLRQTIFDYALPITPTLKNIMLDEKDSKSIQYQFQNRKKYSVNFKTDKQYLINNIDIVNCLEQLPTVPVKIIEFRTPNGTVNPLLWQNYINIFYHILKYVGGNSFDVDRVEYNWLHTTHSTYMKDYVKMNIGRAIEFANLIFQEDNDKIYFLKQYIGDDYSKVKV